MIKITFLFDFNSYSIKPYFFYLDIEYPKYLEGLILASFVGII